jgi:D-glycero-D-manno-heptose 1,7-bisphosphate phosphatase
MLCEAAKTTNALATLALCPSKDTSRYGVVTLDGDRIRSFAPRAQTTDLAFVNGGVYAIRRDLVDRIVGRSSLEYDVLPQLASQGLVAGRSFDRFFIDIGVPHSYAEAQVAIATQLKKPAALLAREDILVEGNGCVKPQGFAEWRPGAVEAIRLLNRTGYYVFIVPGEADFVAGRFNCGDLQRMNLCLNEELRSANAHIDNMGCFRAPDASENQGGLLSRLTGAAAIDDLIASWPLDVKRSFFVGTNETELDAARRAGIRAHRYGKDELLSFIEKVVSLAVGYDAMVASTKALPSTFLNS